MSGSLKWPPAQQWQRVQRELTPCIDYAQVKRWPLDKTRQQPAPHAKPCSLHSMNRADSASYALLGTAAGSLSADRGTGSSQDAVLSRAASLSEAVAAGQRLNTSSPHAWNPVQVLATSGAGPLNVHRGQQDEESTQGRHRLPRDACVLRGIGGAWRANRNRLHLVLANLWLLRPVTMRACEAAEAAQRVGSPREGSDLHCKAVDSQKADLLCSLYQ